MLWCKPYDLAASNSAQIRYNAGTDLLQVVVRLEMTCKRVAPSLKATAAHICACEVFHGEHPHKSVESLQL